MSLDFYHNWLLVNMYKELWSLPHITEANFQVNTIKGDGFEVFWKDKTTTLIHNIVLSYNRLTHVVGIYSDPGYLMEICLSSNTFGGKLPHELTKLDNIKVLHVSYNPGFIGYLPYDIVNMFNLKNLELSYTSLGGVFPLEIGDLSMIQYLEIYKNQLKGALTEEVGCLNHLRCLSIQNNDADSGKITGPLPFLSDLGNTY